MTLLFLFAVLDIRPRLIRKLFRLKQKRPSQLGLFIFRFIRRALFVNCRQFTHEGIRPINPKCLPDVNTFPSVAPCGFAQLIDYHIA